MTHQYIDQSFIILRDALTLDQPLLGRDFLKTNDVKLEFHPSFKTESIESVQPKTTPIHYTSVFQSATESLVPVEISTGASLSNYNHLPSSYVDLAKYNLLHNAGMSNASKKFSIFISNCISLLFVIFPIMYIFSTICFLIQSLNQQCTMMVHGVNV